MILNWVYRILWMLAIWALQVLVFNQIHLFGFITPLIGVYLLSFLPKNTPRSILLLWAFFWGLFIDLFSGIPGVSAASMTFAAFLHPSLLRVLLSADTQDDLIPSVKTMGSWRYCQYLLMITFFHHLLFYGLESFSFENWAMVLKSFAGSWILSVIIMMALEYVRHSKKEKS